MNTLQEKLNNINLMAEGKAEGTTDHNCYKYMVNDLKLMIKGYNALAEQLKIKTLELVPIDTFGTCPHLLKQTFKLV